MKSNNTRSKCTHVQMTHSCTYTAVVMRRLLQSHDLRRASVVSVTRWKLNADKIELLSSKGTSVQTGSETFFQVTLGAIHERLQMWLHVWSVVRPTVPPCKLFMKHVARTNVANLRHTCSCRTPIVNLKIWQIIDNYATYTHVIVIYLHK